MFWQLPNDYRVMVEVRNNGVPLIEQAPKAAITQSIIGLAEALCGTGEPAGEAGQPALKAGAMSQIRGFNLWPAGAAAH